MPRGCEGAVKDFCPSCDGMQSRGAGSAPRGFTQTGIGRAVAPLCAAHVRLSESLRGKCLAAPVPLSTAALTRWPVAFLASGFGLALLVRVRGADGGVCVRRLATAKADSEHQEHDRCRECHEEDDTETHSLSPFIGWPFVLTRS